MIEAAPAAQAPTELASASEVSRVDELLQESREQAAVEDALEEALYDHQISVLNEDIVEEEHLLKDALAGKPRVESMLMLNSEKFGELMLKNIREERCRRQRLGDPEITEEEEETKKKSQAKYQRDFDEFFRMHSCEVISESSDDEQDILLEIAVRVCQFACVCVCGVYRRFYMHAVRAVSTAVCTCTRYPCFLSTRAVSTAIFHARMHRL